LKSLEFVIFDSKIGTYHLNTADENALRMARISSGDAIQAYSLFHFQIIIEEQRILYEMKDYK